MLVIGCDAIIHGDRTRSIVFLRGDLALSQEFTDLAELISHLFEDLFHVLKAFLENLIFGAFPARYLLEFFFYGSSESWLVEFNADMLIGTHKVKPDLRWLKMMILLFRIASLLNSFDVLMNGGISADAILVHSSNKVCLREQLRRNGL